ncbi:low specificity L-threonine aldolase [Agrobacterium tumefaciens]|nr:low specificity L-threonine aldolase [Agrobacterium tumefaciens]NTB32229.1 low specificity L-threonine aldolase [Agrobacterium tumefaciens]NTB39231.1 low specificity L-threonine aldolase [Agrobacterium tumefaciens]NTB50456.1 low specificity L-threonine aldolase [Agrobacterium tumefaciens]NTB55944.1 low specificity L-threonine aldolase [Agrobacterium tumefaciens]
MTQPTIVVDLIFDTATRPSLGMLETMGHPRVGDEQRGEDPTTAAFEEGGADLLGCEKSLFPPSGTMCNQIAFLVHCWLGDEIICAENAHVYGSEGGGASALAGAQFRPIATETGIFSARDVASGIRSPRPRSPRTRVVGIEQTTNRGGGQVRSRQELEDVVRVACADGLSVHMEGASRLTSAASAAIHGHLLGACFVQLQEHAQQFHKSHYATLDRILTSSTHKGII